MEEQWKRIVVDDIVYNHEISSHGRVRNATTKRILKPCSNGKGYLHICLYNKGKHTFYIHRLVADAFLSPIEGKNEINHIDENKYNNHVENLEWCDRKYNVNYGQRTKKQKETMKTIKTVKTVGKPKKQIRCIETGIVFESVNEASRQLNVKSSNLFACLNGRQKTCGGYHWEYV